MAKKDNIKFERIPTGIPGLDKLIEGGLVKGSTTLVAGSTGTGKTILCMQFLLEGLKRGEKCLFVTLEESPEDLINDCARFGWNIQKYVSNGQLQIVFKDPLELVDIKRSFENMARDGISRVAIDSTSILGLHFKSPAEVRKNIFQTLQSLKKSGTTVVVTAEAPEEGKMLTRYGVEEFITDGVIVLHYMGLGGGGYHSLQIRKMRRTDHGKDIYPMEIGKNGIIVKQPKSF